MKNVSFIKIKIVDNSPMGPLSITKSFTFERKYFRDCTNLSQVRDEFEQEYDDELDSDTIEIFAYNTEKDLNNRRPYGGYLLVNI